VVTPIVKIEDLTLFYEKSNTPALKSFSLQINEGEFVGVLGSNGAGKSTLAMATMGIIPNFLPAKMEGTVTILGKNTQENMLDEIVDQGVGIVFQQPDMQLISVNVELEIAFTMENRCFAREEIRKRIDHALKLVRLEGYEKHSPEQLSGGQKQAVCIAIALTMEPHLIILDEPTSQLDPIGSQIVFEALADINKKNNIAILIMEHKAELLARHADKIVVLDKGEKIYEGKPEDVFTNAHDLIQRGVPVPQVSELAVLLQDKLSMTFDPFPIREEDLSSTLINKITEKTHA